MSGLPLQDGLEAGDAIGVRLIFGTDGDTVYSDATFRHAEIQGDQALLGFQFIGLAQTPEGRVALQLLSSKVAEFQKAAQKTASRGRN